MEHAIHFFQKLSIVYIIGIINAIEEDVGQVVSYELLDSTDLFELTDDSALITKASFDQETIPTYNITVRATDNGVPPISVSTAVQNKANK